MTARYEPYPCPGGAEWMLVNGPSHGPQVLVVPPLFEELNFTRTLLAGLGRELAMRNIGSRIMDLPGCGESERPLETVHFADWQAAVAAAAKHIEAHTGMAPHIAALRGGALLDDVAAPSHWRFAPADGASLFRQMRRAQAIGDREAGRPAPDMTAATVDLVGYSIPRTVHEPLATAVPATGLPRLREVPFAGPGVALWRRAEPTADPALAAALATDLAAWLA